MADLKRQQLEEISSTNSRTCRIPQVLDALDITVTTIPNINLYIFELLQNALDSGATRVLVDVALGQAPQVTFQHDGPGGLGDDARHVRGMSNIFQSTKTVGSVGFMGFGFKTIYKRYQTVSVSDINGWSFRFHVPVRIFLCA